MKLLEHWLASLGYVGSWPDSDKITFCIHPPLDNHERVFVFKHAQTCVISSPQRLFEEMVQRLSTCSIEEIDAEALVGILNNRLKKVVGPAWIGTITGRDFQARHNKETRVLLENEWPEYEEFLGTCSLQERRNSGFHEEKHPLVVVFEEDRIVAAANYQVLQERLANVGVLVSPLARGRGHGKRAISGIVEQLLKTNYMIQYQTILSDVSSVNAAKSVGFNRFAETISVPLK